jgi:hypothetical protein
VSYKILFRTVESAYDHAQGQVLSTENRATQTKKRNKKAIYSARVTRPTSNRRRNKIKLDEDKEIAELIRKYGEDRVKVLYDSNP